jgi:2-amino-4-hydroxy-6-hydroxymethyldihydropteridine diphosphokinase
LSRRVLVLGISTVYRTDPVGRPEQSPFYNCVVEIHTEIPPLELKFQVLRPIEKALGRHRTSDKHASRTIDLDLILYEDLVMNGDDIVLPDPDISRRFFLAVPLAELAPDLTMPGTDTRISELAAAFAGDERRPLKTYTALLRREIPLTVRGENERNFEG